MVGVSTEITADKTEELRAHYNKFPFLRKQKIVGTFSHRRVKI